MGKTIGIFDTKNFMENQQSLNPHEYTTKLRESGFTNNICSNDKTGWIPDPVLHSDMERSEYRININPIKGVHYNGPIFSTGKYKKKEVVYKHT